MEISEQIRDWIKSQLRIRVQWLRENPCYRWAREKDRVRQPQGVMVHSTGADNPRLSRYVAPDDGEMGPPSPRHWNQDNGNKGVHAFIGKLKDGTVAIRQTLPWTYEGWHCAGKANRTHIGFECCEDSIDPEKLECWLYFRDVYRQAALLTAHLCARYSLDPRKDGVVICHCEGHRRSVASNHADVLHWWPRFGRDMDDFRRDVWALMQGKQIPDVEIPAQLQPLPQEEQGEEKEDMIHMDMKKEELEQLIRSTAITAMQEEADRVADIEEPSTWAADYLTAALAWGITARADRPQAPAQRQEVLTMIVKALMHQANQLETVVDHLVRQSLDKLNPAPVQEAEGEEVE